MENSEQNKLALKWMCDFSILNYGADVITQGLVELKQNSVLSKFSTFSSLK